MEQIQLRDEKWKADLEITLKVEAISDIFLESFTIRGRKADNCEYFVLNIDKFDVEGSSNNSNMRDRLTIPNVIQLNYMTQVQQCSQAYSTDDTTITTNATIKNINVTDSLCLRMVILLVMLLLVVLTLL